ncbi:MAG: hypothetical protein ACREQ8_08455 [Woeseiaceae bacterium]
MVVLPAGWSKERLPIGVQVVGQRWTRNCSPSRHRWTRSSATSDIRRAIGRRPKEGSQCDQIVCQSAYPGVICHWQIEAVSTGHHQTRGAKA